MSIGNRLARIIPAGTLATSLLFVGAAAPVAAANPYADNDIKEIREELRGSGVRVDWKKDLPEQSRGDENRPPKLGDQRVWLALDDTSGFYLKFFTLRGQNQDAEIWVANSLNFPAGDCRNDGVRNVITDSQVAYLLGEFSETIKPTDHAWFGDPVSRNGKNATMDEFLTDAVGLPTSDNAYRSPTARQVILVDNVRDDNFYDTDNSETLPYIAGFFTSAMIDFHDRNVMTIDSWDWLHRTGATPPHEPSTDPCTSAPARPFLYEGVFAHEYQHLIHHDYDPGEVNWVNEGMSDLAEILTGYSDPSKHVDEIGFDGHIQAFLGWSSVMHPNSNPIPGEAGPENSLTSWGDQGSVEILADYGFAYYFMTYLLSQGYGQQFFLDWAHNTDVGIQGLDSSLSAAGSTDTFESLFRDIVVSAAVDGYIDNGAAVSGADASTLANDATEAAVLINEDAFATAGAPNWGSDYLDLGAGSSLTSLVFDGDETFDFPGGPEWVVDPDGFWTNPDESGTNLYPNDLDADITQPVSVPAGGATLTFEHYYQTEATWDFGFVQVSTDGGATFFSLPCPGTTSDHDPAADRAIAAQMPGYSGPTQDPADPASVGTAAAPEPVSCELPEGTTHISFRMMSDALVQFDGWHVRNVQIDGVPVDPSPADLSDWDNQAFFNPTEFAFGLQLIGLSGGSVDTYGDVTAGGEIVVVRPELASGNTYTLTAEDQAALAGSEQVIAIVNSWTNNELDPTYGEYSLVVNGVEMADGGA